MAKKKTQKKGKKKETPLMKQYFKIKGKYPDSVLLFRVGDFYETFGKDAVKTADILGIVLTKRNNGSSVIELAGFPHHALDSYLPKLVRAGQRVAICDQLEEPSKAKKIVRRGVTELVTPGVSYNDQVLNHNENNFLAAVHLEKKEAGVAFLDISTGEFLVAQGKYDYIDKLLQSFKPSEVVFQKNKKKDFLEYFGEQFYTYTLDDWIFKKEFAYELLQGHFETNSLKGFGIEKQDLAVIAGGAALHYLSETEHTKVKHVSTVSRIEEEKYVWLDRFTIRNLELIYSPNEDAVTLLDVIDHTTSPMGARMLKRWVALPLKDKSPVQERHDIVETFVRNDDLNTAVKEQIDQVGDMERLVSKVSTGRISPREVMHLKKALKTIKPVKAQCLGADNDSLRKIAEQLNPCQGVADRIENELMPDPPVAVNKGNVIAEGVSDELDELRNVLHSGKDYLEKMQERESSKTGIPKLKIAFNNVFGYYIEVRNTHKDKVPDEWTRKQTLVNAERYITEELKEYEAKILGAEEKILILESRLFSELVRDLSDYIVSIQLNAQLIARLDCLLSFADTAVRNNYTRPVITEDRSLSIKAGRHPVIEQQLPVEEEYVPNDIFLDDEQQQIIMITGPNMSGKSAILRQTALITLLAQMGSFVPAKHAEIGLVDKVFTRVGASDNISLGESTFMVEMNETASILNNLSDRSLILLDEIGRGTSTYDGISIAWAIAEFLHEHPSRPKTLFATHYHELNDMASTFGRVKNYNVSVKEINNKIIFLRKLISGGSEHSFGIHVAKMAGMPSKMIRRANDILALLEKPHTGNGKAGGRKSGDVPDVKSEDDIQLSFFQLDDPVLEQVRDEIINTDIDTLSPVEALLKLNEIKKLVTGKEKD